MRLILIIAPFTCLALAGCGSPSLPPETDSTKGRDALKAVLETWKRGGTAEELNSGASPIVARDPDWSAGHKLQSYEIAPEDARAGVDLLLTVKLNLSRPDGRPQEKTVRYSVGIGASTVVLRSE